MLNGVLFRRNEIKDYNAADNSTTWAVLIRIIEGDSPEVVTIGQHQVTTLPGANYGDAISGGIDSIGSGNEVGTLGGGTDGATETAPKLTT
jgi:hypothetical protein